MGYLHEPWIAIFICHKTWNGCFLSCEMLLAKQLWALICHRLLPVKQEPCGLIVLNRPFLICLVPLFQSESRCIAFHMKIGFHSHVDKTHFHMKGFARGFVPLFQSESRCIAFHMKMSFHSHVDKTHFHMKGFARGLALKKRHKTIQEWPIVIL